MGSINSKKVAIAGLGGLGSNIAMLLVRAGIEELHLLDFDVVERSNLNRQNYFECHLGLKKTQAIQAQLHAINPNVKLKVDDVYLTSDNIAGLIGYCDIVVEAFDKPENKAMLVETLIEQCPNVTIVGGCGMAGYGHSDDIVTRKLMGGRLYLCGDTVRSSAEHGLYAPRVMLCAARQANIVLELLYG